jgi:uncharacterized protein (DUF362 family)/Pyruvate/2-oxoacid:ferredoxin oxidoreductase delta subunit
MKAQISLVPCGNYEYRRVLKAVSEAVNLLGGMERFVQPGQKVLLKPNLLFSCAPGKGVTTHPMVVRAVLEIVRGRGGIPFVGDSPAFGTAPSVAAKTGIGQVTEQMGCQIVDFRKTVEVRTPDDFTFRKFDVAREAVNADVVINLPKIKTHGQMLLTLGVKNMFGCFPGTAKAGWHLKAGTDRAHFARMLVELYGVLRPDLTIMDGIVGMEGNGPSGGTTRPLDMVLAGTDCVSLDSTVTDLLGVPRKRLWTTRVAIEGRIGVTDPNRIEVHGASLENLRVSHFRLPEIGDLSWGLPGFLRKLLKDAVLPRPVIDRKRCRECLNCVKVCPPEAMEKKKRGIVIDNDRCIRCFCCQEVCPEGAIEIRRSLISKALSRRRGPSGQ